MQNLQFATHHAHCGVHAGGGFDRGTDFRQRRIGLLLDGLLDLSRIGLQCALGPARMRQGCGSASRPPTTPPILDGAETDGKRVGDRGLGHLAILHRRNNSFAQVRRIDFHLAQLSMSVP